MQTAGCMLMPVYLQLIDKCGSIVYLALQPLRGVKAVSLQQSPSLIPGGLRATAQVLAKSTAALQSHLLQSITAADCAPTLA